MMALLRRVLERRRGRYPHAWAAVVLGGFGLVASVIWVNEIFDVPHLLFGGPQTPFRPREAAVESGLVLLLGVAVTYVAVHTIDQLERLIVVCAWCHRVKLDREWVSLERFLHVHRADTSHGMCSACEAEMAKALPPSAGSTQGA